MDAVEAGSRLNELLTGAGLAALDAEKQRQLGDYFSLFVRWNERLNLSAIRDEEGIMSRHLIESIFVARVLPDAVRSLLDFGSGAGLPGIPIALCRREIAVTLSESQGKKAAFLREAVRVLGIEARVHSGRAETLDGAFDCVILRAVDRMAKAVEAASGLVAPLGWLAVMTTQGELKEHAAAAGAGFQFDEVLTLPGSTQRVLALARRG